MELTIFTPTFNRAYLLPQLYNSLINQTRKDFVWLVVDDGSTDNTRELIDKWNGEGRLVIQYIFQENQGMHGAHNTAYKNCKTNFNVCIDSDDYMPDNAVEIIREHLSDLPADCAGIVGLDADKNNGSVIGTPIPESLEKVRLNELYSLHHVKGDKKLVLKTDIVNKYQPYPLFAGERFVPLDYLYLLIDQDYFLKPVNEIFCIVEYQNDGSSKNMLKQYRRNPNGFAFSRISRIKYGKSLKERFKNAIHLVSSAIFAKEGSWLVKSDRPLLVFLALPFGLVLNLYIRSKT